MVASPTNTDIGSRLLEKKVISEDQLNIALKEQARTGGTSTIGAILISMGFVSEGALGEILNESSGIKKFDLKASIIDARLVKKVPKEFAARNKLIPVSYTKDSVTIAMVDVFDIIALDQIRKYFPPTFKISPVYAPEVDILHSIS